MQGADKFTGRFITSMAGGIANAATRSVIEGTDFGDNLMAALPDIIGQTIGGFVADKLAARPDPIIVNERANQAAVDGSMAAAGAREPAGEQYLLSLTPEQKKLIAQVNAVRAGLVGPNFERDYPLIPNLYSDGKSLNGTVLIRFSDLTAVGDRKSVLSELKYINQKTADGYSINLQFREPSYLEGAIFDLGLSNKALGRGLIMAQA